MRKELVTKLIETFEEDKDVIIRNLLEVMSVIVLEAKNEYEKATLTIKLERNCDGKKQEE